MSLQTNSDQELADKLGVAKQTIATWKKRGKVPLDNIVDAAVNYRLSVDFLLFGIEKARLDSKPDFRVWTKRLADIELAKLVYEELDEELMLTDKGLNDETLSTILSATNFVKDLIGEDVIFDESIHRGELESGVLKYIANYYELMYITQNKRPL
ncbi:TPA: helix-turn-helix domain-containing protein [Vibrio harveyi]|nr:helix-turn-helix domain-containing protein [Vibrio harveyi]